MEEVTKYFNFSSLCRVSAASLGVLGVQQVTGNKDKKGFKGKIKAFLLTLSGVTTGLIVHNLVADHIYTHGHEKSSATKAGVEKALDTSDL